MVVLLSLPHLSRAADLVLEEKACGSRQSLAVSNALHGKISPNMAYSIDPAQWFPVSKTFNVSYVRPSLSIDSTKLGHGSAILISFMLRFAKHAKGDSEC